MRSYHSTFFSLNIHSSSIAHQLKFVIPLHYFQLSFVIAILLYAVTAINTTGCQKVVYDTIIMIWSDLYSDWGERHTQSWSTYCGKHFTPNLE